MLSFLMGARLYDIDIGLQEYYKKRDLISDWEEELEIMGAGYDFSIFQINKQKMLEREEKGK